jgi:hypothetical protein
MQYLAIDGVGGRGIMLLPDEMVLEILPLKRGSVRINVDIVRTRLVRERRMD